MWSIWDILEYFWLGGGGRAQWQCRAFLPKTFEAISCVKHNCDIKNGKKIIFYGRISNSEMNGVGGDSVSDHFYHSEMAWYTLSLDGFVLIDA